MYGRMNLYMCYIWAHVLPPVIMCMWAPLSVNPKCMFASERATSHIGQSAVQTGTRFCIYSLRESCRDDTDGLLHAWAGLTEASIKGSWPYRHISLSVRRPSHLVLLHVSAHSGHYIFSLLWNTTDSASTVLNTSGMYSGWGWWTTHWPNKLYPPSTQGLTTFMRTGPVCEVCHPLVVKVQSADGLKKNGLNSLTVRGHKINCNCKNHKKFSVIDHSFLCYDINNHRHSYINVLGRFKNAAFTTQIQILINVISRWAFDTTERTWWLSGLWYL